MKRNEGIAQWRAMHHIGLKREVEFAWRNWTGHAHVLPDFLIIGAPKCGTTSLYDYLKLHPGVTEAFTKEIHFFSRQFGRGLNWYQAHFPTRRYQACRRRQGLACLTGEASPGYMSYPGAPERIRTIIPGVKLIALLRNPVDRAFSHYQHNLRIRNLEHLSFEEAIAQEDLRWQQELGTIPEDEAQPKFVYRALAYLAKGRYAEQLEPWFRLFGPNRIHIIRSEDFSEDPQTIVRDTFRFLGLPDFRLERLKRSNEGQYTQMNPQTRRQLAAYFAPHNQQLYRLLGRDMGWDC